MLWCLFHYWFSITVSYLFISFVSVSFSFLGSRLWNYCYGRLIRFLFRVSYSFCMGLVPYSF